MTPEQRKLARYAIKLPSAINTSKGNRYVVGPLLAAYTEWMAMVSNGLATLYERPSQYGVDYIFRLTRAGALLALNEGESLNPEDFPEGGE